MKTRYDGKPLLRLIELYVIDAIGALTDTDATRLNAMTPKLQQVYKATGDWRACIEKAMHFPDDMPQLIRQMWDRNQEIARQRAVALSAEQFAVMFVDSNIPQ